MGPAPLGGAGGAECKASAFPCTVRPGYDLASGLRGATRRIFVKRAWAAVHSRPGPFYKDPSRGSSQPGGQVISRPDSTWKCRCFTLCPACSSQWGWPHWEPISLSSDGVDPPSGFLRRDAAEKLRRKGAAPSSMGPRGAGSSQPGGQVISRPDSTWKCRCFTLCPACSPMLETMR